MRKKVCVLLLTIALAIGFSAITYASSPYLTQFRSKYGTGITIDSCSLCHPGGRGSASNLNQFANNFASASIGNYTFNTTLENRDSDGDTFTNIIEINARTFPGDSTSKPATSDTEPPTVTEFAIPAASSSLTVPITTFTATDNVMVTGYKLTETATAPAASATGWTVTAPANYACASAGTKTLYAWAKDAAGNVSTSRSTSVTITLPPTADTTPPTVSLSIRSFSTPRKVNITLTATDDAGGSGVAAYMVKLSPTPPLKSSLNWKIGAPTVFTFPLTSTTGPQTLYAFAKDKTGNVSAAASATVNLDRTKPTINAFSAQATSPASGTVNISVTATDPVVNSVASGVAAHMITRSNLTPPLASSPKWISGSTPPTTTILSTTVKTGAILYAWVKDANGNVSKPKKAKVTASAVTVAAKQAQSTVAPTAQSQQNTQATALSNPPADLTVWVGKWFKVSMKNQGFYVGKSGLSSDRQSVPGYLKIWNWDPANGIFECDLYQYDVQTDQWSSEILTLHYISGSELDFKVWSQVTGDLTYGFTARIQGTDVNGNLTSATFKTLGGYHVQEDTDAGTTQDVAGWLAITGKMVSESEVQVPDYTLVH
jgi:hypothetical protein